MENRTLKVATDVSGVAIASLEAEVLAAVYKSVIPARSHTFYLDGRHSVTVPVYTPWSMATAGEPESDAIAQSDPAFTGATLTLTSKAVAATRCSAEFWGDSENADFRSALAGILAESLHRYLESSAAAELFVGAVASYDVAAGTPPSDADWEAAMGLVVPQALGPDAAFYVNPLNWPGMTERNMCCCDLPPGAVGRYRGYPVFLVREMGQAVGNIGVFGDLSRGLGLALDGVKVRVMDQVFPDTDEVLVQATLRYGVKLLQSGCIATLTAV